MRLIEIINREPPESERQVVVTVDGKPMTIDAGRSITLAVEDEIVAHISDTMIGEIAYSPSPGISLDGVVQSVEDILADPATVEIPDEGDTAAPTDDETTHVQAELASTQAQLAALDAQIAEMTAEAPPPAVTREKLESLTFSQLRELGYQLNVKGTSKEELIIDILAAQEPK
jgi:hypothetical protein